MRREDVIVADTPTYVEIEETFFDDANNIFARGRRRDPKAGSPDANRAMFEQRAQAALGANSTYLGLANPTNAQNAAQIQALTRQVNALIRLRLRLLDSDSGT